MKNLIFFITFFVFTIPLFSFDMILTGDPVLEDLRFLSLKSGRPLLSFTPPLAPAEVKRFLDSINEADLGPSARDAYHRVLRRLAPVSRISYSEENFSLLLNINSVFEARARFNSDISWYPRYRQITPLVSAPLRASFANTIQLYFEPIFAMRTGEISDGAFDSNVPTSHDQFNHEFVVRAFAAVGGDWWNFQIGRDRLFWGTGHTGSLIFSDHSPYFDFARLSFFSANVKYSIIVNQMPLRLSRGLFTDDWWQDNYDSVDTRTVLQRHFYLHRLDFRLFDRLSIGIMEGMMVGDAPLEIRYLNPLIYFHSLFAWNDFPLWRPDSGHMVGSFFSLEVNWNVNRNLAFYGQFSMNEFTLPGETDGHPNAMGWMAGVQFAHSFNNWGAVSFLEFVYTDPYLSILSSPFASFIQMDRLRNYYFIGHPRDTIAVTVGTNFFYRDILNLYGNFSWISSGEHNRYGLIWDWESGPDAVGRRTPTGTAENKFILSVGSGWRPSPRIILRANVTGIISLNNSHISSNNQTGGQASFSVGFQH